jgi:hypothetical protein
LDEKAMPYLSYQTPLNAVINVDDWAKTVHGQIIITNKVKEVLPPIYKIIPNEANRVLPERD